MGKSLERMIAEQIQTPGNISMPAVGGTPEKPLAPKAKGTPAPPNALLTDPNEKLKDIDKVSKPPKGKSAEPQKATKNGDQSPVLQGKSKIKENVDPGDEDEELEDEFEEDGEDYSLDIPQEISELVDSMDEDELKSQYASLLALLAEADEDEELEEENADQIDEESTQTIADIRASVTSTDIDLSEDMDALFSEDENLSEEFQKKATLIFASAVASKVNEKLDELDEAYKVHIAEAIEQNEIALAEKVDSYLNYVVESWMKENEVAVERGLRAEISEDFMSGLKSLFDDHYITIPDEKVDVMEQLATEIDNAKAALNEKIEATIELEESYKAAIKEVTLLKECQGLSDVQIEKLRNLAEGVEFEDEESFVSSLDILKESYFSGNKQKLDANLDDVDDELETTLSEEFENNVMSKYSSALSRQVRPIGKK